METKLVMWTCVCMVFMLSFMYGAMNLIASYVH